MTRTLYVAEPPPSYLRRVSMVVDCSVLVAILFEEMNRETAVESIAGKQLVAPLLIDSEIAHVALKKLKTGTPEAQVVAAVQDYSDMDIEIHATEMQGQFQLARRYGISGYDAAYLWLASVLRVQLLTFDKKLAKAAQEHLRHFG